jgi:UDP-N-acetylmuramyl pentapeptide phosphotransferase/UDP-N-acetylglucosamine-1-phosphate transferase
MSIWNLILVPLAATLASFLATWAVLRVLRLRGVLDHPNERSSHQLPTPRGGGIAVVAVIAAGWLLIALSPGIAGAGGSGQQVLVVVLAAGLALAVLSFFDDLRGLPVLLRLGAQIAAVAVVILVLPDQVRVFQETLPIAADRALTAFVWLWFINAYNFMDGIDGITAVETGSIGAGLALLALFGLAAGDIGLAGAVIAGAAVGFGLWNWHPAKLFLGDVGSIPLGYLLGFLLLVLAAQGQWAAALLLPLYYLGDASVTLVRRLSKRERVWQAHRSHYYQQAARAWGDHSRVSLTILAANLVLIAISILAGGQILAPWFAIILGGVIVMFLLLYFRSLP